MSTVAADAQRHGACLWCSDDRQVVWHDGRCEFVPSVRTEPRDQPVRCSVLGCRGVSWKFEALCPVHERRSQ